MKKLLLAVSVLNCTISNANPSNFEKIKASCFSANITADTDVHFNKLRITEPDCFSINIKEQLNNINSKYRDIFTGIAYTESTSGIFRIHKFAGRSRALGTFGLIPTTSIVDVINNNINFSKNHAVEYKNIKKHIEKKDWISVAKYALNPVIESSIVNDYTIILNRYLSNREFDDSIKTEMFILSWKEGVGGAMQIYNSKGIAGVVNHQYVKTVLQNKGGGQ